ncbi:YczE/YyaS/YitT family protein [Methanobrevibacter sp.]|uniref:YczE/YyaS/YitT family protein n=1 Tax=Methanobrevibacter sp. TaxID=66852 RepID=UPI00388F484A
MQFDGEELSFRRVFNYVFGLYLITLGVAFSIKSGLGSAPVSSIPYAMDLIWLINIGVATFIFHAFLVLIEWILLRENFKRKHFLQVFVGVLFGVFTSFSVSLMNFIPPADNFLIALLMTAVAIFFIALGLFFYVPTNLIPLSVEGVTQAIAIVSDRPFSKIKVYLDISIVTTALILSYGFLGQLGSVGIGTIIGALFIGTTVKYIHKVNLHLTGNHVDMKKM